MAFCYETSHIYQRLTYLLIYQEKNLIGQLLWGFLVAGSKLSKSNPVVLTAMQGPMNSDQGAVGMTGCGPTGWACFHHHCDLCPLKGPPGPVSSWAILTSSSTYIPATIWSKGMDYDGPGSIWLVSTAKYYGRSAKTGIAKSLWWHVPSHYLKYFKIAFATCKGVSTPEKHHKKIKIIKQDSQRLL